MLIKNLETILNDAQLMLLLLHKEENKKFNHILKELQTLLETDATTHNIQVLVEFVETNRFLI